MKINYSYHGTEHTFDRDVAQIIIGRSRKASPVDLDLSPDLMVSQRHARLWQDDDTFWLEDLESAWGTRVNSEQIKGHGPQPLHPGETISIGEWKLVVHIPTEHFDPYADHAAEALEAMEAAHALDASEPAFSLQAALSQGPEGRASFFYHLALQLVAQTHLKALLNEIASLTLSAIPAARHCALLVKDRTTGKLVLHAHMPAEKAVFSRRLAERALGQGQAFIWPPGEEKRDDNFGAATTPREKALSAAPNSAMYAPLQWQDARLGALCVDSGGGAGQFDRESLRLFQAVAHHAAMALWLQQRHDDWRHEHETQQNFLKLVSPQIAERLCQQQRRIHLGGEFRHATILISDIRGFTNLSATMSPLDVTEMLDDYFGRLVPIVFKFHGTVDKFVGDAILAVFGSPEPDEQQHLHAVQAASAMQTAMREVNEHRQAQGKRTSELGIGVHCGEVVHGLIGTTRRMEFTVIGDAFNRASRYCDGAKAGEVLLSPEVYHHVAQLVEVEETSVQTKHEGELIAYHVTRIKGAR